MVRRDPVNDDYYQANLEAFSDKIGELDHAMRIAFDTVPRRELLTYHDAYAYFARRLRLERDRRHPGLRLRGPDTE